MYCRVCLCKYNSESQYFVNLLDQKSYWNELLSTHLRFEIKDNDIFSTVMCAKCHKILLDFHNFFIQVQLCQNVLPQFQQKEKFLNNFESSDEGVRNTDVVPGTSKCEKRRQSGSLGTLKEKATSTLSPYQREYLQEKQENKIDENCEVIKKQIFVIETSDLESRKQTECMNENKSQVEIDEDDSHNFDFSVVLGNLEYRTCTVCKIVYENAKALEKHIIKTHETLQPIECKPCNVSFRKVYQIKRHWILDDNCTNSAFDWNRKFNRTCGYCYKMFSKFGLMKRHCDLYHPSKKRYFCNKCKKLYVHRRALQTHCINCWEKS